MGYIQLLNDFDEQSIPDLDVAVLGALELFAQTDLPTLDIGNYQHPLVVGSGNAAATSKIIFEDHESQFASESNFALKLDSFKTVDVVVLISASGSKHSPKIAQAAKDKGLPVVLVTNTANSPASQVLDDNDTVFVYPKNREPYTYNTSTYMGMILGHTAEEPRAILEFIQSLEQNIQWPDFSAYDKYFFIVPPEFAGIIRMMEVKFIELFGRNIARDIETSEYVSHATTVAPSNELFISFGQENTTWGTPQNRLTVPLPDSVDYGAMMAIGYYTVAQIQKAHPSYFKDHIVEYTQFISEIFGSPISAIVEK